MDKNTNRISKVFLDIYSADGDYLMCTGGAASGNALTMAGMCGAESKMPWYMVRDLKQRAKSDRAVTSGSKSNSPKLSDIKNNISTRPDVGGKFDSAQQKEFPNLGNKSQTVSWLNDLQVGMDRSLRQGFNSTDYQEYLRLENSECGNIIMCRLYIRQDAIYLLMGGQ